MDVSGKNFKAFIDRQAALKKQYSSKNAEKQHSKGKLTAHERINLLFDSGTFEEIDAFVTPASQPVEFGKVDRTYGDGVIVGHGKINGRLIFAYAQDFTIMGGSLGLVHSKKITKIQEMALKMGAPIIGMMDSGGARIQEGVASLSGYASIFQNIISSSGIIPQISVIMGPAAGGAVYSPALTDFVFMVSHTSYMFVTGPNVVKEVLNEDVTSEGLGGAEVHARKSGVANMIYDDEENTILALKKFLSYLPSNNVENPPVIADDGSISDYNEKLRDIVPDDPNKAYDVKDVINQVVDRHSFFEISELFGASLVIGFGRMRGKTIGIVANQPKVRREPPPDQAWEIIRRYQRLVILAARNHLYRMECLRQALTLKKLLGGQGIVTELRFGIRKEAKQLLAHAWLEYEGHSIELSHNGNDHFEPLTILKDRQ